MEGWLLTVSTWRDAHFQNDLAERLAQWMERSVWRVATRSAVEPFQQILFSTLLLQLRQMVEEGHLDQVKGVEKLTPILDKDEWHASTKIIVLDLIRATGYYYFVLSTVLILLLFQLEMTARKCAGYCVVVRWVVS